MIRMNLGPVDSSGGSALALLPMAGAIFGPMRRTVVAVTFVAGFNGNGREEEGMRWPRRRNWLLQ